MKVRLKKLNENAKLPTRAKTGDFCHDVWAVSEEEIAPNIWKYGLGFKYEIDRQDTQLEYIELLGFIETRKENYFLNECDISIDLRPRSGIWKTGMSLANSEGTLDEFFRGEACAIFYHVMPNMPRYKVGDKIGQIKIGIAPKVTFEWADEINEDTERGEGGFGSTGNN